MPGGDYRALVANPVAGPRVSPTRRRYLSKNNNNLLRLDAALAQVLGQTPSAPVRTEPAVSSARRAA